MSDNNKTYTIYTRLNYLKGFHASNASNVSKFEAALMRNLLELSVVLNDLTRSMRRDNDIPV
jgi:hypothetical protein